MTRRTHIDLDDQSGHFIDAQLNTGRYGTASEVVRSALQLLENHQSQLATLREALIAGEQSGPAEAVDIRRFVAVQTAQLDA